MSSEVNEDVARLFECFKCGVTPPQSAVREQNLKRRKLKQASSAQDVSTSGKSQQNGIDTQTYMDKFDSETAQPKTYKSAKQISPLVFYGSPCGVPPKRASRLLRLLREIHVDLTEQSNLNFREELWATFPRQDEAMKFVKCHHSAHVFSYQDHMNGQRRFLVSTYKEFWQRYKRMDSKVRHHYEVIQEGLPCHLYFDLEFNKRDNAEKDGDEMVDLLISVILEALLEKYSIHGSEEWVVELDSSTEEKFSRHLIIRIPKAAFKDNSHVGAFVTEICSRISCSKEEDRRFEKLFVLKDSAVQCYLFVDTAVYSRNRCFRLALSSKAGKNSVLLPTGRFKCKDMSEEDMFMASLICKMDIDCEKLLICKMDLDCVKTLYFDTEEKRNFGKYYNAPQRFAVNACTSNLERTYFMGKSPFPALDMFIESIASSGNVSGKVRSWYWFSEYGLMVYNMSRNRYCERIGREHKSNHVMYVIDIKRAVYYQKCHDPDCRGYRSPLRPVPLDSIPDTALFSDSVPVELKEINLECDSNENGQTYVSIYCDESTKDGCFKDGWWHEAIKVADSVENMQKSLKFSNMVISHTIPRIKY